MKHRLFALAVALVLIPLNFYVIADEYDNLIINGGFENPAQDVFSGGFISDEDFYEGNYGYILSNPFGDVSGDKIAHRLELNFTVSLNKGSTYNLSLYAKTYSGGTNPQIPSQSNIYVSDSGKNILLEIYNLKDYWQYFSHSFFAIESGDYSITIYFYGESPYDVFCLDNISLNLTRQNPERYIITGSRNLYIPDEFELEYTFTPVILDREKNVVSIFGAGSFSAPNGIPTGVSLDSKKGVVKVSNKVIPGSLMTLVFEPDKSIVNLPSQSIEIVFNKNLIPNSTFDDYPYGNGWSNFGDLPDTEVFGNNRYLSLYVEDSTPYGYMTTLTQTQPVNLKAGKMYVFRARVKSTFEHPSSDIFEDNIAIAGYGDVSINIFDIGGEDWKNVYSAFIPEQDGEYYINLNLYGMTERPIFIDDVSLQVEEPYPVAVKVSAPGNIYIPDYSEVYMPYECYAKNQMGGILYDEETTLSVYPQDRGVTVDEEAKVLVISPYAREGEYILKGTSISQPDVTGQYTITLSKNRVGDGGFEDKIAGVWWMSAAPSTFSIKEGKNNKYAQVDFDFSTLVLNNSYATYLPDVYYIIKAEFKSENKNARITAFIDDAFDNSITTDYAIAQFNITDRWEEKMEFFRLDEAVTGRLILYLESESDNGSVLLDNISIEEAKVEAKNVSVMGNAEAGRTISGVYDFSTNFGDTDASITRWYIGNSPNGPFDTIGTPNQKSLKLSDDMVGKYVRFEVTPIANETGIVGPKAYSEPIRVKSMGVEIDNPITDNQDNQLPKEKIKPKIISNIRSGNTNFLDLHSHWAKNDIEILAAAGIVNGKGLYYFDPDSNITRAEFTSMIIRAFSIVPEPYSGRFNDVKSSDWYSGNIEAAFCHEIIFGFDDGNFYPNEPITREQLAVIIMRAYYKAGGEKPASLPLIVADRDEISGYAADYVQDAFFIGLLRGYENNMFNPKSNATRAEAATIIARLLRYLEQ